MNALIFTLVLKSFCMGWISNEYGHTDINKDINAKSDYEMCILDATNDEIFSLWYINNNHQDTRIAQ